MAKTGQVNTNVLYDSYFWVYWSQYSQDVSGNKTRIYWSCGVTCGHNFYSNAIKMSAVTINGVKVYSGGTYSNFDKGEHRIAYGYLDISHNADGKKDFTISAFTGWLYSNYNYSASAKSYSLEAIPRYAQITSFSVSKRDETSVIFNWTADATCDYAEYSKDGGTTWIALPTNNIVTGLSADTAYDFKLRVRRKDSQLKTVSSAYSQTTYNYPYCTGAPDFTIGDTVALSFYNPLSRQITFEIIANGNTLTDSDWKTTGTSYRALDHNTSITKLYDSIKNAQSGKYQVKVTYGSSVKTNGNGTYKIKGTEKPTVGEISYADSNDTTKAITQNPQHIVQNLSNLLVTFTEASGNNSATIKKYEFELNGIKKEKTSVGTVDFGKVNSASNLTLTMTVTDSRGLTAKATKTITMLAHSEPTAVVTLERLNNYEDETYLTVDGSASSVDGKNSITIEYRYKLATDSYSPFVSIPNNQKQTLVLDKNSIFVFNVVVTDAFKTKFDREFILYKGVFPLFIDTEKNAVGINDFPAEGEALCVAEGVARFNDGIVLLGATKKFLLTVNDNGVLNITDIN